jgi:mono/diheme cytochrome c family protein
MKRFATPLTLAISLALGTAATAAFTTSSGSTPVVPVAAPEMQVAQAPAAEAPKPDDPAVLAALVEEAAPLFRRNCSSCHGTNGEGGIGPRLAASASLESQTLIINQVLFGSEYMPAFGETLDNHQVSAIATYIRNSWGNAYPIVTEEAVAALRAR